MTKPFKFGDDYVIIDKGKKIKFPSYEEAIEYYDENSEE